jgi:hypothetical protein
MKLDEWPARKPSRLSVVDRLPADVVAQLIAARRSGTHSVSAMAEWLVHEGFTDPPVTVGALRNYFAGRGISIAANDG